MIWKIISFALLLAIGFVMWLTIRTNIRTKKECGRISAEIAPVVERAQVDAPNKDDILNLAQRTDTRGALYRQLTKAGRSDLFPKQYSSLESIAESDMVVWLMHPNELSAIPDEIVLGKAIERLEGDPSRKCLYFVFKFRTNPPQWAARRGWMAGVAGPYPEGADCPKKPACIYSELEPYESRTPEGHLDFILKTMTSQLKTGLATQTQTR